MEQLAENRPDPEMIENLELLLNLDVIENESDWNDIDKLRDLEKSSIQEEDEK